MSENNTETRTDFPVLPPVLTVLSDWAWRFLAVCGAVAVIAMCTFRFSVIIIALLVAMLLAVVLEPLNSFLHRKARLPKSLSACLTVLFLAALLFAVLWASGTGIYQGFYNLSDRITGGMLHIVTWAESAFPNLRGQIEHSWDSVREALQNNSGRIVGGLMMLGSSVGTFSTSFVFSLFALFFFLKDGRQIWHWFVRLFPCQYRNAVNESGIRAWVMVGSYARTQTVVALVDAVGIGLIAYFLGTPVGFVLPIFVFVFLGAFIPVVGALLSGSVAVLLVLVNSASFETAGLMLLGVLLVQQTEGNVLQPVLQGNALSLHALAIFILVSGGTVFAGIFGAVFAVPIAAAVNVILLYLNGHDIYPYLDTDPNRPGGPKQDFAQIAQAHWEKFDSDVAQKLSPREKRRLKWEKRKKKFIGR